MIKHTLAALILSVTISSFTAFSAEHVGGNIESVISLPSGHFFKNVTFQNDYELVATDYTGMSLYKYHENGQAKLWSKVDGHPVSIRLDERGEGLVAVHKTSILKGAEFLESIAL